MPYIIDQGLCNNLGAYLQVAEFQKVSQMHMAFFSLIERPGNDLGCWRFTLTDVCINQTLLGSKTSVLGAETIDSCTLRATIYAVGSVLERRCMSRKLSEWFVSDSRGVQSNFYVICEQHSPVEGREEVYRTTKIDRAFCTHKVKNSWRMLWYLYVI